MLIQRSIKPVRLTMLFWLSCLPLEVDDDDEGEDDDGDGIVA